MWPIKWLEILPGMRISTQNLQKFYVKRFMAKNIVKELYFVDSHQILTGIFFFFEWKKIEEFCLISKPVAVTTEYLIQPADVFPLACVTHSYLIWIGDACAMNTYSAEIFPVVPIKHRCMINRKHASPKPQAMRMPVEIETSGFSEKKGKDHK